MINSSVSVLKHQPIIIYMKYAPIVEINDTCENSATLYPQIGSTELMRGMQNKGVAAVNNKANDVRAGIPDICIG